MLIKYETPNPNHGQYEILLDDRDHVKTIYTIMCFTFCIRIVLSLTIQHEKELIKLMVDIDQYSEERDDVSRETIIKHYITVTIIPSVLYFLIHNYRFCVH